MGGLTPRIAAIAAACAVLALAGPAPALAGGPVDAVPPPPATGDTVAAVTGQAQDAASLVREAVGHAGGVTTPPAPVAAPRAPGPQRTRAAGPPTPAHAAATPAPAKLRARSRARQAVRSAATRPPSSSHGREASPPARSAVERAGAARAHQRERPAPGAVSTREREELPGLAGAAGAPSAP